MLIFSPQAAASELRTLVRGLADRPADLDADHEGWPVRIHDAAALDREATAYLAELEATLGQTGLFERLLGIFVADLATNERALAGPLAAGDAVGMGRTAHTIKGAAATIGARQIERLAQVLELGAKGILPLSPAVLQETGAQLLRVSGAFRSTYGAAAG